MTEERTTTVESPDGQTHTNTTVIREEPRHGGGSGKWLVLAALVLIAIISVWAISSYGGAEAAKDNAIANAANEVGDAAGQVGDAAQDAANSLNN